MNSFLRFFTVRVLSLIPTIFGVILITFVLSHVVPGNPALILIGPEVDPSELKVIEAELGLNQPLYVQFFIYLRQLIHFNLGYSYILGQTVNSAVGERFPATLELAIAAMILIIPVAILSGIYASLRANKLGDHAVRVLSLLGNSIPIFFLEIVLIMIFYVYLGIAPSPYGQLSVGYIQPRTITGMTVLDSLLTGNIVDFFNALWHIALPALALATAGIAIISRVVRSSMLDVINKDYMRTAFAIGFPRNVTINKYALRNALLPAITVTAIQAGGLMSGVVITETIYSWQGIGLLSIQAIFQQHYPVVMAVVILSALAFILVNFVADIIYAYVDPRVRL